MRANAVMPRPATVRARRERWRAPSPGREPAGVAGPQPGGNRRRDERNPVDERADDRRPPVGRDASGRSRTVPMPRRPRPRPAHPTFRQGRRPLPTRLRRWWPRQGGAQRSSTPHPEAHRAQPCCRAEYRPPGEGGRSDRQRRGADHRPVPPERPRWPPPATGPGRARRGGEEHHFEEWGKSGLRPRADDSEHMFAPARARSDPAHRDSPTIEPWRSRARRRELRRTSPRRRRRTRTGAPA